MLILHYILNIVTDLLNHSPIIRWKQSKIIPVPKKGTNPSKALEEDVISNY